MKHDVFSLIIYVAYEHAKRRGITALATACDRSDPGRAYSCAKSAVLLKFAFMALVPSGVLPKFVFMALVPSGVLPKFAFRVLVPSGVLPKFAFMVLVPSGVLHKFAFMALVTWSQVNFY